MRQDVENTWAASCSCDAAASESLAIGERTVEQLCRALESGVRADGGSDAKLFAGVLRIYERALNAEADTLAQERGRIAALVHSASCRHLAERALRLREEQMRVFRAVRTGDGAVDEVATDCTYTAEFPVPVITPQTTTGPVTHVVMLIHGIRTQASWLEKVASVLRRHQGIEAYPVRYGYFDVLRFLFPVGTRSGPAKEVERQLRLLAGMHRGATMSVIAHSFGAYTICRVLVENPDIRIDRLVLCGSVVDSAFRWDRISDQVRGRVLNDCGAQDVWPLLAAGVTVGYGPSGTFGFRSVKVRDRFHAFPHSGYFDEQFVQDYWVPYLLYGSVIESTYERSRGTPPWWQSVLPFAKYIVAATACVAVTLSYLLRS